MNAKKIMGAVLVALLAAALFVGAGAAAFQGTYFVYQKDTGMADGVWNNGAATVTFTGGVVYPSDNFVAGTYKKGDNTISVSLPTATYAANATIGTIPYLIANEGKVYQNSKVNVSVVSLNTTAGAGMKFLVTYPNGTVIKYNTNPFSTWNAVDKGTYKVQAVFADNKFVTGAPVGIFVDANSFSFTVVGEDDVTISASTDKAYNTEAVTFTVVGTPGEKYNVTVNGFDVATNQLLTITETVVNKVYNITIQNDGKATFVASVNKSKVTGDDKDVATLTLGPGTSAVKDGEIKITIAPPVVTATLEAASYFLGDDIVITGTSTSDVTSTTFKFNISGTNIDEYNINPESESEFNGKNWKVVLATNEKLDVGTYTIKIYQGGDVVKTLAVALKQPFISILTAPEVVAKDTKADFVINAEAADKVQAYVFGTNYFEVFAGDQDDNVANKFTVTLEKGETKKMAAGQYFVVFQHPMYNGIYNIFADNKDIILNTSNAEAQPTTGSFLFNVTDRQTANAAQALCDALDSQNIDDMYVKYSFFVVGDDAAFTISDIPTEVVKGEQIVISGVDTANAGQVVTVDMISTAFAAVPKEEVNAAAFIVVTTEVAKDGSWEVTLDTSDLNVDEYSLSVVIKDATKKNVKVNVVEGADKPDTPDTPDVPDTPDTPDTPTEPETPGFGALAALAGLGAVAVLLLRRE